MDSITFLTETDPKKLLKNQIVQDNLTQNDKIWLKLVKKLSKNNHLIKQISSNTKPRK